jgi:hypothetical protein
MEYTYDIIENYKVIFVKVSGILNVQEVALMGKTIRLKAKELNYKILFDFTHTKNKISTAEAYFWFTNHYDKIDMKLRYIPTAHISNEEDKSFFYFFETTCYNKCIKVKMFMEKEKALEWLKSY